MGSRLPHRSHVLSHSHGCRGGAPANAVVIEWCEAPNGNATSLPARSPLGPGANDYCYSLVPMPPRRRVWRFQAETDAASAPRSCCSKLDRISARRRRKGALRAAGSWRRGRLSAPRPRGSEGRVWPPSCHNLPWPPAGTVSPRQHRAPCPRSALPSCPWRGARPSCFSKCFGITRCKQSRTRGSVQEHWHGGTHPVQQPPEWSLC